MNKTAAAVAVAFGLMGAALSPQTAEACGGCFAPTETQQVVTDHRMVMSIGARESILWDQIRYTGRPEDFSWVLPVQGDVRIELASGEFFDALDQTTAVQVQGPIVQTNCGGGGFLAARSSGAPSGAADAGAGGVEVVSEAVVGPYQTVTLRSQDSGALATWLRSNNYVIPPSIQPVIDWYVERRMDFVALRLRPGEGVQSMQPVRIRYATASPVLPLRMVAAGIADKVGILLWVFGNGRYEAANFANGTIDRDELVWNWDTNGSNYRDVFNATLRRLADGRSWITEMASDNASQFQFGVRFGRGPGGAPVQMTELSREDWALATNNNDPSVWVTRMRADLPARFLDADLTLQASANTQPVSRIIQVTRTTGRDPTPRCPSATVVPTGGGFACATATAGNAAGGGGIALGALAGAVAMLAARRRRRS